MPDVARLDPEDWTRLRAIRLRALVDAPEAFGSSLAREEAQDETAWRRLACIGPWWIAVGGGGDVGLVAAGTREDDAAVRVYAMWVDPGWRGRGVGDALLDAVCDHAATVGAPLVSLDVTDRVPRARRFYERYGFVPSGAVQPLERDPTIRLAELTLALPRRAGGR